MWLRRMTESWHETPYFDTPPHILRQPGRGDDEPTEVEGQSGVAQPWVKLRTHTGGLSDQFQRVPLLLTGLQHNIKHAVSNN